MPPGRVSLGVPMPEEPLEGQRRAPHCKPPLETINGGCWVESRTAKPPCGDLAYEWKGNCYVPYFNPPRKPTSEPP
jgi:eukaryotic-like serine/threonine-protein kinase